MRRAKNLYLDSDAIQHAEEYAKRRRINLSQLVSDFLRSLPLDPVKTAPPSAIVQRLLGAGLPKKSGKRPASVEDYHRYLMKKYGGDR